MTFLRDHEWSQVLQLDTHDYSGAPDKTLELHARCSKLVV